MELAPEQTVFVKGRVVRAHTPAHSEPNSHWVQIALSDGQNLQTNVVNLASYDRDIEAQGARDLQAQLQDSQRLLEASQSALAASNTQADALQAEVNALRELLRAAEARARQAEAKIPAVTSTAKKQK